MSEREAIEEAIRAAIADPGHDAITLSNTLFGQHVGLFPQLARHVADRRSLRQSPLGIAAMQRLRDLESIQIENFRKTIATFQSQAQSAGYGLRMERTEQVSR